MLHYIARRLLLMVPTLLGITFVVFAVMALAPGGVGASLLSSEGAMRPEERAAMRQYLNQRYGLDLPWPVQYLRWLNNVSPVGTWHDGQDRARGIGLPLGRNAEGQMRRVGLKVPDLGMSFTRNRPVIDVVLEAAPITILLNLLTIPIIYGIAITTGIRAAHRKGTLTDVGIGTLFIALWSLPTMWVGVMLIGYLANRDYFHWFPTSGLHDLQADTMRFLPAFGPDGFERGWLLDSLWHLVLPLVCYTYGGFAVLSKLMRASVLENITADYVRTARAKGVDEHDILYRHVLRNSVLPLITVAAAILPGLLGGSVVIEQIFSINGMGKLMVEAIFQKDRELILSETLVIGCISLLSLLLADLLYAVADPRVSYE